MTGWIGVDLDGTLAEYDDWIDYNHIGNPVPNMVNRVKKWIKEGKQIKIFTARICDKEHETEIREVIERWCIKHIGYKLPITNVKDYGMIELWDDRTIQIIKNTGIRADGVHE